MTTGLRSTFSSYFCCYTKILQTALMMMMTWGCHFCVDGVPRLPSSIYTYLYRIFFSSYFSFRAPNQPKRVYILMHYININISMAFLAEAVTVTSSSSFFAGTFIFSHFPLCVAIFSTVCFSIAVAVAVANVSCVGGAHTSAVSSLKISSAHNSTHYHHHQQSSIFKRKKFP